MKNYIYLTKAFLNPRLYHAHYVIIFTSYHRIMKNYIYLTKASFFKSSTVSHYVIIVFRNYFTPTSYHRVMITSNSFKSGRVFYNLAVFLAIFLMGEPLYFLPHFPHPHSPEKMEEKK